MKVDFKDRKYWKTQKCNNLIKSVDFLAKSTSDVLCNFVFIFHWDDGVISMNFYPIWPVIYAQSNSTGWISNLTGHEILVKLGWNSLRIHCMPPWSNWVSSQWIQLASISMDLLPIWLVEFDRSNLKFDRAWNTGQIGWKFTEITFVCLPNQIGYHPSDSHPIWGGNQILSPPVRIRPGMKYWSNLVEIHWDYICMPA